MFGYGFGTLKEATDAVDAMVHDDEKDDVIITLYDEFRQVQGYGDFPKEDVTARWDGVKWEFSHDINKKGYFDAYPGHGALQLVTALPTGNWKNGPLLYDSDDDLEEDDSEESDSESSESYYDPVNERILRKLNKLEDNLDGLKAVEGLAHALGEDALLRITDDGTPGVEIIYEVADFNWAYEVDVNNADIVTPYHVFIPFCDGFFTDDELAALDRLGAVDERTEAMKKLNKYVRNRGGVDEEERRVMKLIN